jgi:hypothetical protein
VRFESSGACSKVTWDDSLVKDERVSMFRAPEPIASRQDERAEQDRLCVYLEGTGGRGRVGGGPGQGGRLLFAMLDSS